jgi:hypothetical protein
MGAFPIARGTVRQSPWSPSLSVADGQHVSDFFSSDREKRAIVFMTARVFMTMRDDP